MNRMEPSAFCYEHEPRIGHVLTKGYGYAIKQQRCAETTKRGPSHGMALNEVNNFKKRCSVVELFCVSKA